MGNIGIVVADAPGTCIQYYEEAIKRLLVTTNSVGHLIRPVVCAVNRAGLKLHAAGYSFPFWSSWHYYKLLEWSQRIDYHGKLVTNNNTSDGRFLVRPVGFESGSSTFTAAQILYRYYDCPKVIIVNAAFSGDYSHYLKAWKEKAQHLEWCRAYTGPLKNILGVPTKDWLTTL